PAVVDSLGDAFPELTKNPVQVAQVIREEEEAFLKTLDRGMELFETAMRQSSQGTSRGSVSAQDAFKLHDTYGFPIDLTRVMAEERGMTVDIPGDEKLREQARERARAVGKTADSAIYELPPSSLAELTKNGVKPTDDSPKFKLDP